MSAHIADILIYAFRYALGRSSYAPADVMEALRDNASELDPGTRTAIIREIRPSRSPSGFERSRQERDARDTGARGCATQRGRRGGRVSDRAWERARRAFEEFETAWSRTPGASRADAVRLAFAADDAIERLWALDPTDAQDEQISDWLEVLGRVPEVEKRWVGLAEYRLERRVGGAAE